MKAKTEHTSKPCHVCTRGSGATVANTLSGRGDSDETFAAKWDAERRARAEIQNEEERGTLGCQAEVAPPAARHGEGWI